MNDEERRKVIVTNGFEVSSSNYECPSCFFIGCVGTKKTIIALIFKFIEGIHNVAIFVWGVLLLIHIGSFIFRKDPYAAADSFLAVIALSIFAPIIFFSSSISEWIFKFFPQMQFFCPECGHRGRNFHQS